MSGFLPFSIAKNSNKIVFFFSYSPIELTIKLKGLSQKFYPAHFRGKTNNGLRILLELRNPTHKKLARLEVSKSVQIAILCQKIAKMIL